MDFYKKQFSLIIDEPIKFKEKLEYYFKHYQFKKRDDNNSLIFYKKWSLLDGWKLNPLNWESEIEISLNDNVALLKYTVCGNVQITPIAFASLFDKFIDNFKQFVYDNSDFKIKNKHEILLAKNKYLKFFIVILVGITIGFIVSLFINKFTDIKLLGYLAIAITANLSLKLMNNFIVEKAS